VSAQCIDGSSALANKQITAPVDHQHALLFFALDRDKPHSGPLNRLATCLGIGGIVFVGLDVYSDIARWHLPGVMTQFDQLARPEMGPTASLQPDHAWCQAGKQLKHLCAGKLAAEHDLTTLVDTVNLNQLFAVSNPIVTIAIWGSPQKIRGTILSRCAGTVHLITCASR
jgi:hypothetical protein